LAQILYNQPFARNMDGVKCASWRRSVEECGGWEKVQGTTFWPKGKGETDGWRIRNKELQDVYPLPNIRIISKGKRKM